MPDQSLVGIIGAGPAGSTLARLLAKGGMPAVIIDEREPHEKPCGGGVTFRGYRGRPALLEAVGEATVVREAVLESQGARVEVALPEPVRIYPRRALNRILLEAALAAGARFLRARVVGFRSHGSGFRIQLAGAAPLEVGFLAGADGAAGISRKILGGGRGRRRFVLAAGYHGERVPGDGALYLAFPPGLAGYLWIFPRGDHSSVGICSRDPRTTAGTLREALRRSLAASGRAPPPIPGTAFAFPIPDFTAFEGPRAGPRWALIGDAGGFVDPITLEGIPHALRSAELLASALLDGEPARFESDWRADFGSEIGRAARIVDRFYRGDFTARMVRSARGSSRVRGILGRLLAGAEPYRGLGGRVARGLLADRAAQLAPRFMAHFLERLAGGRGRV